MIREIELPNNFNVINCSSYLDGLTNKNVSPKWLDYINNMNNKEIFDLIIFASNNGFKIGFKELNLKKGETVSIVDLKNYLINNITPAFLKKAIDNNKVKFCENWYRGKYVDKKSGETQYIYFEGQADIYALHNTTYTCGLPPPPGWRPLVLYPRTPAGWFMYNNTDLTPLEENMKIIDGIRGKLQNKSPDNHQVSSVVTPSVAVHGASPIVTPSVAVHGASPTVTPSVGVHSVVTPSVAVHGARGGNKCKKRKYTNKRKFKKKSKRKFKKKSKRKSSSKFKRQKTYRK